MNRPNISQSLIKKYQEYEIGLECGLLFEAVYIKKTHQTSPSDAMRLGQYFEYKATGATLRDGTIPEAETTAKGTLTAPYQRAEIQAVKFNKAMESHGFKILDTGTVWEYEEDGIKSKAILDVFAERYGQPCIIDLKFSGLLENKWEDHGWADLRTKYKLLLQPIHYKWLGMKRDGIDYPFYFFVHSSANEFDYKIFRVDVSPGKIEDHGNLVKYIMNMIEFSDFSGWQPKPDYKRCITCPLKESCTHRHWVPQIETVTI